jgi:hypothetical protein
LEDKVTEIFGRWGAQLRWCVVSVYMYLKVATRR